MENNFNRQPAGKTALKWTLRGIIIFFVLLVVFSSFYTVKSTERGVLSTFGRIQDRVIGDGLHFKIPFVQTVKHVNIQQKKFDGKENSYTRDVQTSEVDYTINYDLVKDNVAKLMKNVGEDYHNRIVVPFIRSAMLPFLPRKSCQNAASFSLVSTPALACSIASRRALIFSSMPSTPSVIQKARLRRDEAALPHSRFHAVLYHAGP